MGYMQTAPRSRHDNSKHSWKQLSAACALVSVIAACGGGGDGDSAGSGDPGSSGANTPIMRAEAVVGDYFVYETTQTAPVNASVLPYTHVQTIRSLASDGTYQRVSTYTNSNGAQQSTYNASDAAISVDAAIGSTAVSCVYSPASTAVPPYPRTVGQTWGGTYTQTCSNNPTTYTVSGRIEAREQLALPAGTFDAFRAVRAVESVMGSTVFSQAATCWFSVQRGAVLRCDYTNTTRTLNSTTPGSVISSTQALTGLGGPARAAVGGVLQRFAGSWRVQYTGGASGTCPLLRISAAGAITGNCVPAGSTTSFAVTGTVNTAGAVTIALPSGGALSGTLTNPYAGAGTWVDGSASGAWTTAHN